MQPFEIVLAIVAAAAVIQWATRTQNRWIWFALGVPFGFAAILHFSLEGYRWQMIPVYAVLLAWLALTFTAPQIPVRRRPVLRSAVGLFMVLVIGVGVALSVLLPVFHAPAPTGPYAVGTQVYQLTDPNRDEFFTDDPNDKREIAVQVWYPAPADATGPRARWLDRPDLYASIMSAQVDMPPFFFNHVNLVTTNSIENAPVAEGGPYPVLIYSHGWTAWRGINTDQVENLASHGYVVIAPEHAYGANLSILPDGRTIYNLPSIVPDRKAVGEEAYMASVQQLVDSYAGDVRFCIDKAGEWNDAGGASIFGGRLDLTRIGIFGHSTGGGAIAEVMAEDNRVKAACAMDLWAVPVSDDLLEQAKATPFLGLESEIWSSEENSARLDRFRSALTGDWWYASITGTRHNDFTIVPLATPVAAQLGMKGPLNGKRVAEIVNTALLDFFDHTLKDADSTVLGGDRYGELRWVTRGAGS